MAGDPGEVLDTGSQRIVIISAGIRMEIENVWRRRDLVDYSDAVRLLCKRVMRVRKYTCAVEYFEL